MSTSPARKVTPPARLSNSRARRSANEPIIIYATSSLDGTSFALDPSSQQRIREAFPGVQVSTRHIFIAHDTREAFEQSIGRFEDQIAVLLSGVSADRLTARFSYVSFRDPKSEREIGSLPQAPKRAARQD
jgi:hypothetical protein